MKVPATLKRVLIIDDNAGILFVLKQALMLKGYEVYTSETFEGVRSIEKISPNLIFLDISLVGQDGREVAKEIKSGAKTKNIPIIIVTAYPNAKELALEAGVDDFLSKPFDLQELWKMAAKYTSIA